jgi:hypothetical protein
LLCRRNGLGKTYCAINGAGENLGIYAGETSWGETCDRRCLAGPRPSRPAPQGVGKEIKRHDKIYLSALARAVFSKLHVHPINTGPAMAGVRRWSAGHGWGRGDSAAGAGAEMVRVACLVCPVWRRARGRASLSHAMFVFATLHCRVCGLAEQRKARRECRRASLRARHKKARKGGRPVV